ncbi:hypothetical protein TNCV_2622921 [Trichonephila clavipes]|nr:hypothetical protein TNCV_2622921 [Trichonephila clavipes]
MTPLESSRSEGDDPLPDDILPEGDRNDHVIVPQLGVGNEESQRERYEKIRISLARGRSISGLLLYTAHNNTNAIFQVVNNTAGGTLFNNPSFSLCSFPTVAETSNAIRAMPNGTGADRRMD